MIHRYGPDRCQCAAILEMARSGSDVTPVTTSASRRQVRFSDNRPVRRPTSIKASASGPGDLEALRNRNSIDCDQCEGSVRHHCIESGGHVKSSPSDTRSMRTTSRADEGIDFADPYAVSRSGRRSLGYTHLGQLRPERQDVTLQLQTPAIAEDLTAEPQINAVDCSPSGRRDRHGQRSIGRTVAVTWWRGHRCGRFNGSPDPDW